MLFIIFIKVFLDLIILFKYSSNAFHISGINIKKRGYIDIVLLNIRLIKF